MPMKNVSETDVERWKKLHRSLGREFPDDTSSSNKPTSAGPSLAEVGARVFNAPNVVIVDEQEVYIQEPSIGQLKKLLASFASSSGTEADALKRLPQFQTLMLGCLEFDGSAEMDIKAREKWFDDLSIDEGLDLIDAFAEAFDFAALMSRVQALMGKVRAVAARPGDPRRN